MYFLSLPIAFGNLFFCIVLKHDCCQNLVDYLCVCVCVCVCVCIYVCVCVYFLSP